MRHLVLAVLVLTSRVALADDDQQGNVKTAAMTDVTDGDVCAALAKVRTPYSDDAKCKKLSKKKVKGLGAVTLYRVVNSDIGWTRYAIAIVGDDGATHVSAPLDVTPCNMSEGSCAQAKKAKPKLRAITIGGAPSVALDLDQTLVSSGAGSDTGHVTISKYRDREFLACGKDDAGAWQCTSARYGGLFFACTASMESDGGITFACEHTMKLSFGKP